MPECNRDGCDFSADNTGGLLSHYRWDHDREDDDGDDTGKAESVDRTTDVETDEAGPSPDDQDGDGNLEETNQNEGDDRPFGTGPSSEGSSPTPLFERLSEETTEIPKQDVGTTSEPEEIDESQDSARVDVDQDAPMLEPKDVRLLIEFPFDYAAARHGGYWRLEDREADRLSQAWTKVANKYAPHLLREYTVEIMAAIATVSVVLPRLREMEERETDQESEEIDEPETRPEPEDETKTQTEMSDADLKKMMRGKI